MYGFGLGPKREIHYYTDKAISDKANKGIHDIVAERKFEAFLKSEGLIHVDERANAIERLQEEKNAYVEPSKRRQKGKRHKRQVVVIGGGIRKGRSMRKRASRKVRVGRRGEKKLKRS
jgi:hypothetical protein